MRKLKRPCKSLMIFEAGFIYCKRHNLNYDTFIDEEFMTEDFECGEDSEYDNICKDLRLFRVIKDYKLKTVTVEEYELCVDKFGQQ